MSSILKRFFGYEFEGLLGILGFYLRLLPLEPLRSFLLITTGVLVRSISVIVFVLTFKVFLSVIQPESVRYLLDLFIESGFDLDVVRFNLFFVIYFLVGTLFALIVVQFLLNKVYSHLFLSMRTRLMRSLVVAPITSNEKLNLHICLDHFPIGFDGIIKTSEIIVFYFFLIAGIFYLNIYAGLLVLILLPFIIVIIVIKGRKEVHVRQEMVQSRKKILSTNDDISSFVALGAETFKYARNSVTYAQFFAGLALVSMMFLFMFMSPGDETKNHLVGLPALILVFSIRFAFLYAGELSRSLSRVLQQRVFFENIEM